MQSQLFKRITFKCSTAILTGHPMCIVSLLVDWCTEECPGILVRVISDYLCHILPFDLSNPNMMPLLPVKDSVLLVNT